jgi:hypothetical protein
VENKENIAVQLMPEFTQGNCSLAKNFARELAMFGGVVG